MYGFKLRFGLGEYLSGLPTVNLGISHAEDIFLIYRTPLHPPNFVYTDEEKLMSEKLLEIYASFAKKG
jgi:Carboxylesterase family